MPTRVAFVTTCRSDYGPCRRLLRDLSSDARFVLDLIAGGSHLATRHGMTLREVESDGFTVSARIPFELDVPDVRERGRAAASAVDGVAHALVDLAPEVVVLYGDRIELLAIGTAAYMTSTPIAHVCGGDLTEGAVDDQVRHAVSKLAHVHFPSTQRSGERLLQLGEEQWRVHVVGDPALDAIGRADAEALDELSTTLGFRPGRETLIVTLHPTTLDQAATLREARGLAEALRTYQGPVVITAPAPDPGADVIRSVLEPLARERRDTVFVESLGSRRYHALLRAAGAMVGNSSSGIIEAASVPLPVVNIGSRQGGRDRSRNVIDTDGDANAIELALARALSDDFRASLDGLVNPYGDGNASVRIRDVLATLPSREQLLAKRFVDYESGSR